MTSQVRTIKIYTVKIDPCLSNYWYYNKVGQTFECILVSKESRNNVNRPAFAIVEKRNNRYVSPGIVRTIRPEDCTIVKEVNEFYSTIAKYRTSFSH